MDFCVTKATYLDGFRIALEFEDGSSGVVDLECYPAKGPVFQRFLDPEYFRSFKVESGTLVWGDGETDIAPETLHARATGKTVSFGEVLATG